MPSETESQPQWSERLDMTDVTLAAEGLPYVLIQAFAGPDGDDDLRIRLRAGNGAGESIGTLPLMALGELPEEHNPLIKELRSIYNDSDISGKKAVVRVAEALAVELGEGYGRPA